MLIFGAVPERFTTPLPSAKSKCSAWGLINTSLVPDRLSKLPVELDFNVRVSVLPDAVKVPVESSKSLPFSITKVTLSPSEIPPSVKVWKPSTALPRLSVPVPEVLEKTRILSPYTNAIFCLTTY